MTDLYLKRCLRIDYPYKKSASSSMKIILNINGSLLADAGALAAQQHTSLSRLIEEGLRLRLSAPQNNAKNTKPQIRIYKGQGGLVAGLNPTSNKAMLDVIKDKA